MKIVIAPDSFKESAESHEVAAAIERGMRPHFADAQFVQVPVADGGEGTFKVLTAASGGVIQRISVVGPAGELVEAQLGFSRDGMTAFIEMAEASGIHLVPSEARNPMQATSFGTGQLIAAALDAGVQRIILGIGGSATNDGGIGMMQALGVQFLDSDGLPVGYGGGELARIAAIDLSAKHTVLDAVELIVACDVSNPLLGEQGATYVYGAQKGADKAMQAALEAGMAQYAAVATAATGRDAASVAGSGAAGGLGAALLWFTSAKLYPGIDIVLEEVGLAAICTDADIVITGEGKIDGQTVFGKVPVGVAKVAPEDALVIAVCGITGDGFEVVYEHGINAVFSVIHTAQPLEWQLAHALENIEITSDAIGRLLREK
ncbi:glycerate kinase [Culicoidibacter larvae]|uniref:Glycerate kinase n=1 Tax=Culicoidibacter larvae TaxID=2579976 RepID=A0A5R8QFC2_9FIRM|nr:glycerate kinase [Culicoidibacter larvae]TLG76688.1 glycerate kinase [Culicoidibacter larvae]